MLHKLAFVDCVAYSSKFLRDWRQNVFPVWSAPAVTWNAVILRHFQTYFCRACCAASLPPSAARPPLRGPRSGNRAAWLSGPGAPGQQQNGPPGLPRSPSAHKGSHHREARPGARDCRKGLSAKVRAAPSSLCCYVSLESKALGVRCRPVRSQYRSPSAAHLLPLIVNFLRVTHGVIH